MVVFSAPQGVFCQPGALLSFLQLLLGLPELSQVEGGDLLRLLDLLLVGLHLELDGSDEGSDSHRFHPYLALQLVDQGLHPLVVLAILVGGKAQLLDGPQFETNIFCF